MSSQVFEPLKLLPIEAVPEAAVLAAGRNSSRPDSSDRDYSDLFPHTQSHLGGVLGNYMGGDPSKEHPLYPAVQGLYAGYYEFANQESQNGFQRTEATSQGMRATMLQQHIARCLAKGYNNISEQSDSATGIQAITGYIEDQEAAKNASYNDELDYHAHALALLDRRDEEPTPTEIAGIPVISGQDIALALGQIPESPEVEREHRREWSEGQISVIRKRLVRLRFEYVSALALTQLLRKELCVS